MKAKKFVKQIRKILTGAKSDKEVAIKVRRCVDEYTKFRRAAKDNTQDTDDNNVDAFVVSPTKISLPANYRLLAVVTNDDTVSFKWILDYKGREVGVITSEEVDDAGGESGQLYATQCFGNEMGHDCIDTLQKAVDTLIDEHGDLLVLNRRK